MTTKNWLSDLRRQIRMDAPLILCLTSPVYLRDCANAISALGGKPVLAEHPGEVGEITASAGALYLSLGSLTEGRMEAMQIAVAAAKQAGVPWLLDLMEAEHSQLRLSFARRLMEGMAPALVKGTAEELRALAGLPAPAPQGETGERSTLEADADTARQAAAALRTVVLLSGKVDLISDGSRTVAVRNGSHLLSYVPGSGCVQGALAAAFLSKEEPFTSAVAGAAVLGLASEFSAKGFQKHGSITQFADGIVDGVFALDDDTLESGLKLGSL